MQSNLLGVEISLLIGLILLIWLSIVIAIIVLSCRTRTFVFMYHSHTITVTVKASRMSLFVDETFEDEFGGNQVWRATLRATVEGTEIKARVVRRVFSYDVEVYADGERIPLSGMGK